MKSHILKIFLLLLLPAAVISCRTSRAHKPAVVVAAPRHLPPGHAKKIYGHRSARAFAPGQRKKGTTVVVVQPKGKKKGKKH